MSDERGGQGNGPGTDVSRVSGVSPAGRLPAGVETLPTELRPAPALLKYYALSSLLAGPFFWVPLAVLFVRYRTLRYRIDEEGISMRWGALFRREVSLNYGRIQDIHLSSNVVERWLGLGRIQVQTASGSAKAEMTLEGLPDVHGLRDFLYTRMRGARGDDRPGGGVGGDVASLERPTAVGAGELGAVLREVAAEVRALRRELAERAGSADAPRSSGEGPGDGEHA